MAHALFTVFYDDDEQAVRVTAMRKDRTAGEPARGTRASGLAEMTLLAARGVGLEPGDSFEVLEEYAGLTPEPM